MARSEESKESEPALILPERLIFVSLGTFILVCGGIWFAYQTGQPGLNRGVYSVCVGLMVMGAIFIGIGLGIGRMALTTPSKATKSGADDNDRPVSGKS